MTVPMPGRDTASSRAAVQRPDAAPGGTVALAQAVAGAVQSVVGVAALSPGRGAEAATYGPGKRVVGVVVDRSGATQHRLEVRIIVAQLHQDAQSPQLPSGAASPHEQPSPVLPALAERVRQAAIAAAGAVGVSAGEVDVYLDDIQ